MGVWLVYASDSSRGIGMGRGVGWGSVWGRKAVTGPYNTPLNDGVRITHTRYMATDI